MRNAGVMAGSRRQLHVQPGTQGGPSNKHAAHTRLRTWPLPTPVPMLGEPGYATVYVTRLCKPRQEEHPRTHMATIRDVAKHVGVSPATVSRRRWPDGLLGRDSTTGRGSRQVAQLRSGQPRQAPENPANIGDRPSGTHGVRRHGVRRHGLPRHARRGTRGPGARLRCDARPRRCQIDVRLRLPPYTPYLECGGRHPDFGGHHSRIPAIARLRDPRPGGRHPRRTGRVVNERQRRGPRVPEDVSVLGFDNA